MPLAELVSDFDEQLKSLTSGYASFSYELAGYRRADIVRVGILLAGRGCPLCTPRLSGRLCDPEPTRRRRAEGRDSLRLLRTHRADAPPA